jgi:hypothetical protein
MSPPQLTVMGGKLGDIFWDLSPWIVYAAGFDLGCRIYVANPTDTEKEYALMARLSSNETLISEEALPVFGYTWFKVAPGDFVRLQGALRFEESDADLTVLLVERETQQPTDSVATTLVAPTAAGAAALPPAWPGAPGTTGFDWSSVLMMMMPVMMLGMIAPALVPREEKKEEEKQLVTPAPERKLLPPGREE